MDEKTVLITEHKDTYQIQNNGISEFALIGILECIVFDLKSASRQLTNTERQESPDEQNETNNLPPAKQNDSTQPPEKAKEIKEVSEIKETEITEDLKAVAPEPKREAAQLSAAPDLRTRIGNAVKAIRGLGAQIEDTNLSDLTEEELQSELEELTSQYKRLKNSKGKGK